MPETIVIDELVELVADMLCCRAYKRDIKAAVKSVNGGAEVCPGTIEKVIRRARALNRERLGTTKPDEESKAIGLYEHVIREADSQETQLRAQEAINNILGLGAKFGDAQKDPREQAEDIRDTLREMQSTTEVAAPEEVHGDADGKTDDEATADRGSEDNV